MINEISLQNLKKSLQGELHIDLAMRSIYATDASAYREMPIAVVVPKNDEDIKTLIKFANENGTALIPRAAGTSLAGQVVGSGIVVDVSKYFNGILEVNEEERWVRVQPGVIRDELNMHLKPFGLFFAPETSTANRAMIGGMIGNNSCGANSLVYGSTREHLISVQGFLSDGSEVEFSSVDDQTFQSNLKETGQKAELFKNIYSILSEESNREEIENNYPKNSVKRRNTGYAIDILKNLKPFKKGGEQFNFCKLIAGSEGTLMFITEAKLNLVELPLPHSGLLCIHFNSIYESLRGNLVALKYSPTASELMDSYILECTKGNIGQRPNRFFVEGDPQAILVVELRAENETGLRKTANDLIADLKEQQLGYHYPFVTGEDTKKVWELRKAGLGLLSNMPGDPKPVPVIEDTAVDVQDLPDYINEFNAVLKRHDLYCVHYAHAGSGELHLRPILNLKTKEGNDLFRKILEEIATLVKKYKGSLSGEHGDGRLRGEFIPFMVGEKNYQFLRKIKKAWDPDNIFNPGKIVDTPPMNTSLRYEVGQQTKEFDTALNFDANFGLLRAAEQCNGSGDCRKTHFSGGTMCPSYMATKNEKDTTRARANILREILTHSTKKNPFDSSEIKEVMDLCLSCKGCKSECPSNVDVAKLKAEFQHQYHKTNGIPFRSRLMANISKLNRLGSGMMMSMVFNFIVGSSFFRKVINPVIGISSKRSVPKLGIQTFRSWFKNHLGRTAGKVYPNGKVYLFCDEFLNYNDGPIGAKAVLLLNRLGIEVKLVNHAESGRTFISKGLLDTAKRIADKNVDIFNSLISSETPLIGIEPSAILTFRDEYPDLVPREKRSEAEQLAYNCLLIDEYLEKLLYKGILKSDLFNEEEKLIKLHGHCYQKALSSIIPTKKVLSIPENFKVELIPSGCCGMAGSFGYEKEHYDISMRIGGLVLFPTIKNHPEATIAATGTSCRHQIADGTARESLHPVEILYDALIPLDS